MGLSFLKNLQTLPPLGTTVFFMLKITSWLKDFLRTRLHLHHRNWPLSLESCRWLDIFISLCLCSVFMINFVSLDSILAAWTDPFRVAQNCNNLTIIVVVLIMQPCTSASYSVFISHSGKCKLEHPPPLTKAMRDIYAWHAAIAEISFHSDGSA